MSNPDVRHLLLALPRRSCPERGPEINSRPTKDTPPLNSLIFHDQPGTPYPSRKPAMLSQTLGDGGCNACSRDRTTSDSQSLGHVNLGGTQGGLQGSGGFEVGWYTQTMNQILSQAIHPHSPSTMPSRESFSRDRVNAPWLASLLQLPPGSSLHPD